MPDDQAIVLLQSALERMRPAPKGLVASVREAFLGWFGPGVPMPSQAPLGTPPRQLDFAVGYNYRLQPRGEEPIGFEQLRALGDACEIARLAIETRKNQFERFKWSIAERSEEDGGRPTRKKNAKTDDPIAKAITEFLRRPDRRHTFKVWSRMLLEDLFVIDAPCLYAQKTVGGDVYSLDVINGATIFPLLDQTGRQPCEPGLPAYRQITKGLPAVDFAMPGCEAGPSGQYPTGLESLVYAPRNRRSHRIYGFSPVEQIVVTINIAIRRALGQLDWFTEGSVPDAIVSVPDGWSPQQVREFDIYWQSQFGTTADRRKMRFIPQAQVTQFKPAPLKDDFDEWIARVVSWAFDLPPTWAVKLMNRAGADRAQETATDEGLIPTMLWFKDFMELVIAAWFGAPNHAFTWQDVRDADPDVQSKIRDRDIRNGSLSVDEAREQQGLEPIGMGHAVYTAQGPVLLANVIEEGALSLEERQALKQPPMLPGGDDPNDPPAGDDPDDAGGNERGDGAGGRGDGEQDQRGAAGGAETGKERKRPASSLRKITGAELGSKKKSWRRAAGTAAPAARRSASSGSSWQAY